MKQVNTEVYEYYKKEYPDGVILFHVGLYYEAYNDDVAVLSQIPRMEKLGKFTESVFTSYSADLKNILDICRGIRVHIVSYIDESGNFVLPKVKQILADIMEDY